MRSHEEQEALEAVLSDALKAHKDAQNNLRALREAIELVDSALSRLYDAPLIDEHLIQSTSDLLTTLRDSEFGLEECVEITDSRCADSWEASN